MQLHEVFEVSKKMMAVWSVLLAAALLFSGCSKKTETLVAAPLGDRTVLEALEKSWNGISEEKLAVSPVSLPGDERKKFLAQVFADAGYDYSATLVQMATQGFDKKNKLHTDMAELVLMPHRHPRVPMDPAEYYSADELKAVAVIEREFNKP